MIDAPDLTRAAANRMCSVSPAEQTSLRSEPDLSLGSATANGDGDSDGNGDGSSYHGSTLR